MYSSIHEVGPEPEARKARVLPLIAQDPKRVPDTLFSGPDIPLAADAKQRMFGLDQAQFAAYAQTQIGGMKTTD